MEMISLKGTGKIVGFAEHPADCKNFLPEKSITGVNMIGGTDREMVYGDEIYVIEKTDKEIGIYAGDICPVCRMALMADMNGCSVCTGCSASLKCGL